MEINKGTHSYCYLMSGMLCVFEAVCDHCKLKILKLTLTVRVTLHVKTDFHGPHAWQHPFNTQTVDDCQYALTLRIMPRAYLSENEKWQAIGCIKSGQSIGQTANQFNKSKSVISRLWNRYHQTGSVKIRTGRGRKPKTTARNDRQLVLLSLRNRFKPASKINS